MYCVEYFMCDGSRMRVLVGANDEDTARKLVIESDTEFAEFIAVSNESGMVWQVK